MDRIGMFTAGGTMGGAPLQRQSSYQSSSHVTPRTLSSFENFFRQNSSSLEGLVRVKFRQKDREEQQCHVILDTNAATTVPVLRITPTEDESKVVNISINEVISFKTEGPECILLKYKGGGDDRLVLRPDYNKKNDWVFAFQKAVALYLSTVIRDKKNVVSSDTKLRDLNRDRETLHDRSSSSNNSEDSGSKRNYSVDDNNPAIFARQITLGYVDSPQHPGNAYRGSSTSHLGSGGFSVGGFNNKLSLKNLQDGMNSNSIYSPNKVPLGASPAIPITGNHMFNSLSSSYTGGVSGSLGGIFNLSGMQPESRAAVVEKATAQQQDETKLARSYVSPDSNGSILLTVMGPHGGDDLDEIGESSLDLSGHIDETFIVDNDEDNEDDTWRDNDNDDDRDDYDKSRSSLENRNSGSHQDDLQFDLDENLDGLEVDRDSYQSSNSGGGKDTKDVKTGNGKSPIAGRSSSQSPSGAFNSKPSEPIVGSFNGRPLSSALSSSYSKSATGGGGLSSLLVSNRLHTNSPDNINLAKSCGGVSSGTKVTWESGSSSRRGPRDKQEDVCIVHADLYDPTVIANSSNNKSINYNNSSSSNPNNTSSDKNCAYFAVYDGHGGFEAAKYLSQELHGSIFRHKLFETDLEKAIEDTCISIDKTFCGISERERWSSGTTALGIVIRGSDLIAYNIGDCQAVICNTNGEFKDVTEPHKPSNKLEKERIEKAKGWITEEKELYVGKIHLMDLSDPEIRDRVKDRGPVWTCIYRVCGDLSVSRSIGDGSYKNLVPTEEYKDAWMFMWPDGHNKIFLEDLIIPNPDIRKIGLLSSQYEFLILASDGLWDVVEKHEAVKFVRTALAQGKTPVATADDLSELAIKLGTSDNVTVIIIKFTYS